MGKRCWAACLVLWICISVLFLTGSLLLFFLLPPFMVSYINQQLPITPGHATYDQLKAPILPLYKDVYFFNLTNPDEFSEGQQPKLVECGPYSFRETRIKFFNESSFNWNKTRLTYTQQKLFHFSAETSGRGLNEDDTICTINVAMVAVIAEILGMSSFVERIGAAAIADYIFLKTKAKNFICQPAAALVFNYTDPLVQELHTNRLLKDVGMNLPTDYVSMQFNNSANDLKPNIISTGVGDLDSLGQFHMWDGQRSLNIWYDKYANMINGTEGMLFKPHLQEGEEIVAFVDDAYRSIPLGYVGKETLKGFHTFRYEIAPGVLDSAFKNPENARWGSWCPDGLFYLGAIQKPGVPVFASKPRFLDADPMETTDKIKLPSPDRNTQDTYALVHPLLGLTLQFTRSLQLNLQINQTELFPQLKQFKGTTYYPVFYVTEHAELNEHVKKYILAQGIEEYRIAKTGWKVLFGVLLSIVILGLLVISLIAYKMYKKRSRRHNYEPINNNDDEIVS